jgi:hypothetical protein
VPEIISHDGPVGTATIKIVPDLTGFTESIRKAQYAIVLHGFALWLSTQGLLNIGGQGWRPGGLATLVDQYLATTEGDESASES